MIQANALAPSDVAAAPLGRRYKILYVQVNTTTFAGIERVLDTMCELLAEKYGNDFDIDLLYTSIHKGRPTAPRKFTTLVKVARSKFGLMRAYRSAIKGKEYDLIVVPQIEPTVICMASCFGLKRKFAVYLHGNPRVEDSHIKAKILFFLMKRFFLARVTSVFGISARQLEAFQAMFNNTRPQYQLPNPVRRLDGSARARQHGDRVVTFVNVGRFDTQKGQDILLQAFAELLKHRRNVKLKLVGHGAMEPQLRDMIKTLELEEHVAIEHHPIDPQPALAASDVFVATSRWEGWSLSICEALRFGLPVISTDCEFGPNEILIDQRLGRLVPLGLSKQLVDAMIHYCDNLQHEQAHVGFRKDYMEKYSPESVVDVHARALHSAIQQTR